jgi:hydrogenase maturation factor
LNSDHLGDLASDLAGTSLALARRFSNGATMWCVAIGWPHHANHVAVEFVHPVIVGKRALPAVAITDPDPVSTLRALVRRGDIIIAIGSSDEAPLASALRRAAAWGVESVWIGAGPRPDAGAADHVLWADGPADRAAHAGSLVLLYHLLWELTHVCFEHPGLLKESPETCEGPSCVTCGDEGRLAEVMASSDAGIVAVRTAAGTEDIDITLVGPVAVGDLVLVHAGAAIAVVEPAALSPAVPSAARRSGALR